MNFVFVSKCVLVNPIHSMSVHDVWFIPILESGLADFAASVAKLFGQFMDHIFEYYTVNVLPKQVNEEPVPHIAFANHLKGKITN